MIFWLTSVDLSIICSGRTLRWFKRFVEEESENAGGGIGMDTVSRHDLILHVCAEILEGVTTGWFSASSVLGGGLTPVIWADVEAWIVLLRVKLYAEIPSEVGQIGTEGVAPAYLWLNLRRCL